MASPRSSAAMNRTDRQSGGGGYHGQYCAAGAELTPAALGGQGACGGPE